MLYEAIERAHVKFADHISELVDIICVAEEATIQLGIDVLIGPNLDDSKRQELNDIDLKEAIAAWYVIHGEGLGKVQDSGNILAGLVQNLTQRLARHDSSIRDWADHLTHLGSYIGIGRPGYASSDELSKDVVERLRRDGCESERWSKWSGSFP